MQMTYKMKCYKRSNLTHIAVEFFWRTKSWECALKGEKTERERAVKRKENNPWQKKKWFSCRVDALQNISLIISISLAMEYKLCKCKWGNDIDSMFNGNWLISFYNIDSFITNKLRLWENRKTSMHGFVGNPKIIFIYYFINLHICHKHLPL